MIDNCARRVIIRAERDYMEKAFDIVSLGEILIDFVPDGADSFGDEKYLCKAGGAPLNVLATGAKFGIKTAFIGKVGNDIFGKKLLRTLADSGVDSESVIVDGVHNTTLAFVKLDENGDRDFSFYRGFGADIYIDESEVDTDKIAASKIFHFGSLLFTDEPMKSATLYALKIAKENGCVISYDPNYRPPLWKSETNAVAAMRENIRLADIVKLSKEEAYLIADTADVKEAIKTILACGVTAIAVTDGAGDVYYSVGGEIGILPAEKVKAVDTTGAGDIFFGTLLMGFVRDGADLNALTQERMKQYVGKAIEISAKSVTKKGAIASIPSEY